MISTVQTILDETAGAVYWPQDRICDAINATLLEVWPALDHEETHVEISVRPSDVLVMLPVLDIMVPKYLVGQVGKYFPTTAARMEQYRSDWRTAGTGYPKHFVLWDEAHLRPYPLADKEYLFDVYGLPWPTEVTPTASTLSVDPLLQQSIAHIAAAKLMSYSQPAFAAESTKEGQRLLHDYQVRLRNSQSHNILRIKPGTVFTAAQSGSVRIGRRLS